MDTNRVLSAQEYKDVKTLFDFCDYTDIEDCNMNDFGAHRNLHGRLDFIGLNPPFGRGPVYHFAAKLLEFNRGYWLAKILEHIPENTETRAYVVMFTKNN